MTKTIHTVGRRKRAIVRLWLTPGKGSVLVNKRSFDDYFSSKLQRESILAPLTLLDSLDSHDILAIAQGGGFQGQASAMCLALSRALIALDPNHRQQLKPLNYLHCDARRKERKKYGQPGARKRFQYSKR